MQLARGEIVLHGVLVGLRLRLELPLGLCAGLRVIPYDGLAFIVRARMWTAVRVEQVGSPAV
jgi:hypothetical protein